MADLAVDPKKDELRKVSEICPSAEIGKIRTLLEDQDFKAFRALRLLGNTMYDAGVGAEVVAKILTSVDIFAARAETLLKKQIFEKGFDHETFRAAELVDSGVFRLE